jgi:hypothetical protein
LEIEKISAAICPAVNLAVHKKQAKGFLYLGIPAKRPSAPKINKYKLNKFIWQQQDIA